MKKLFLAMACSVTLFSCKRDDDALTPPLVLHYQQTFCADPWESDALNGTALEKMRHFLDMRHLYHTAEYIRAENSPEFCLACECHTGGVIYVSVLPTQEQDYLALGFQR